MVEYAELHCHSYFSLLDASSSPEALVQRAKASGLRALALTDHDSLAGAVRFYTAARKAELHGVIGAEVTLETPLDPPLERGPIDDSFALSEGNRLHLTLLAENQQGYANLCRLLTSAHLRPCASDESSDAEIAPDWPGKVEPFVTLEQIAQHHIGLLVLAGCRQGPVAAALLREQPERARDAAIVLLDIFGRERMWMELQHHCLPDDDRLVRELMDLAHRLQIPCVATHNVHYATQEESLLRDAMIAIRHNQPLTSVRKLGRLPFNSNYALPTPEDMALRFAEAPDVVRATLAIAERCNVAVDFSGRRLPAFPVQEHATEFSTLYQLCHDNLLRRYPRLTPGVLKQLAHELDLIERIGLAGYFLIVWDLMRFAREHGIRCQGRGSAANSIVAYLLGITAIDPLQHNLLFERFLSADRYTMPDIDVDFAADRREEVIQYVYQRYGADHTAMVCNVVTYKARSAIRDLGKALEFPLAVVDRLAKSLESNTPKTAAEQLLQQIDGDAPADHPLRMLAQLMRQIDGCPRHLSIHVGGMLITSQPLAEVVPLERASMPGRVVCQWNKDSIEDAGLIKIDVLSLCTLGMITEALAYIDQLSPPAPGTDPEWFEHIPLDDPAIYQQLQEADTIGVFQVESRAQQQMLPRLRPERFEDIVVEVAIVRPGPIQGGAVHPYLRRRDGLEPVTYAHPCLEPVLSETLGVLLFQEQAIRVAVVAAAFSPGEADLLRRALGRYRNEEISPELRALGHRFIDGATRNGLDVESAEAAFKQLSAFASYGLCKSHAAGFALIAYQTVYLKRYHPIAFYCALLNQQPMGFYSIEVIMGDAHRHGVDLLPPDINRSQWKYVIESPASQALLPAGQGADSLILSRSPYPPSDVEVKGYIRAGLHLVSGLGEQGWKRIEEARAGRLFASLRDFCLRTRLPRDVIADLIRAGTFDALSERRQLLWELGEIDYYPDELPLDAPGTPVVLPELSALEQTGWEWELLGLSPSNHPLRLYRDSLRRVGAISTAEAKQQRDGRFVRIGGLIAVKQRPPTAKGILFLSLEDETGIIDAVVKPDIYDQFKPILRHEWLLLLDGEIQHASNAVSLLVRRASRMVTPA